MPRSWKHTISETLQQHAVQGLLLLILVGYLVNGIQAIRHASVASDEPGNYNYAIRLLQGKPERIRPTVDNSKMPISVLNTLPRAVEQLAFPGTHKTDFGAQDLIRGRYITLAISLLTLFLVYAWSSQLYGKKSGVFSAFLFSICPNQLAASTLVTTDAYSCLFLLSSIYFLWKSINQENWKNFLLFCLSVGMSQLAKQSLTHLFLLIPVLLGIYHIALPIRWNLRRGLLKAGTFIGINWLIINLGFYFFQTGSPLASYHFVSHFFQQFQLHFRGGLPVPFPRPYVEGLDMAKYYDELGGGYDGLGSTPDITILGHTRIGAGFWYYYFVSLLFKTPLSYLIFLVWGIVILLRKSSFPSFMAREFFLFMPVAYFLILLDFFYQTQNGIRHIIFIYPFIYVFSGIIISGNPSVHRRWVTLILCVFLVVSVLGYHSNYFSYTNELIWEKKNAVFYVGASNLSYGQAAHFAQEYRKEHPEIRLVPRNPQTGTFILEVGDYLDFWNRHEHDWIRRIRPSGQVAHAYLLITVDSADLRTIEAARTLP